jgi:hypothetical protein
MTNTTILGIQPINATSSDTIAKTPVQVQPDGQWSGRRTEWRKRTEELSRLDQVPVDISTIAKLKTEIQNIESGLRDQLNSFQKLKAEWIQVVGSPLQDPPVIESNFVAFKADPTLSGNDQIKQLFSERISLLEEFSHLMNYNHKLHNKILEQRDFNAQVGRVLNGEKLYQPKAATIPTVKRDSAQNVQITVTRDLTDAKIAAYAATTMAFFWGWEGIHGLFGAIAAAYAVKQLCNNITVKL